MFIGITQDAHTGIFYWELLNGNFERVGHGQAQTKEEAQRSAKKAEDSYLYWLKYYRHRGF